MSKVYKFQLSICRGHLKNFNRLINLRALKSPLLNELHIFQCMGKTFCEEFQRYPLKFHTKYLTHTLKDTIFIQCFKIYEFSDLQARNCFWNATSDLVCPKNYANMHVMVCFLLTRSWIPLALGQSHKCLVIPGKQWYRKTNQIIPCRNNLLHLRNMAVESA